MPRIELSLHRMAALEADSNTLTNLVAVKKRAELERQLQAEPAPGGAKIEQTLAQMEESAAGVARAIARIDRLV